MISINTDSCAGQLLAKIKKELILMEILVLSTLLTQAGAVIMTQKHLYQQRLVAHAVEVRVGMKLSRLLEPETLLLLQMKAVSTMTIY